MTEIQAPANWPDLQNLYYHLHIICNFGLLADRSSQILLRSSCDEPYSDDEQALRLLSPPLQ